MIIVVDTNIFVSGLLNPFGAPAEILRMVLTGTLQLCYDARISLEYREVLLRPKFLFHPEQVDILLEQIKVNGKLVACHPLAKHLPDIHDEVFLEAAIAGRAEYLVTGNLRHFPLTKKEGVLIVSPKQFLEIYRKQMN